MTEKFLLLVLILTSVTAIAFSDEIQTSLDWSIETSKKQYYPGEPVLLSVTIINKINKEIQIQLGDDGYGAFSIEVYDINYKLLEKSEKFERKIEGVGELQLRSSGILDIPAENAIQHKIIFNALCSTKLPLGKYHIVCKIEPLYFPWKPGDPLQFHIPVKLPLISKRFDIEIIKQDKADIEKIIQDISKQAFLRDVKDLNSMPKIENRRIAREILSLTEFQEAVPHQLKLLYIDADGWTKRDTINTLAKSGSLEAATSLVQMLESKSYYFEGLQKELIKAVYKLRETEKPDILEATNNFTEKYKPAGLSRLDNYD